MRIWQTMRRRAENDTATAVFDEDLGAEALRKISLAAVRRGGVAELIAETLDILYKDLRLTQGTITLRDGDYLFIEASHGLDSDAIKKGVYKIGEGITGRVAEEGKAVVIKDISKNADFLDKTSTRKNLLKGTAFICAPIVYMEHVIGTLSVDRRNAKSADLDRDLEIVETVANILADAAALIYLRHEESNKLLGEKRRLKQEHAVARPPYMLGNCGAMQIVYEAIALFAQHTDPVFIRGKSGTGKELAAKAIAENTPNFDKTLKVVNCAALPEYTLLGELFGFEKNAFAHAHFGKEGLFETRRTIFLDEAAEISPSAQKALAEALESGKFRRINGREDLPIKARIICASCADVEKLAEQKMFDKSLYAAISKNTVHIPALRDRKSDILLLAEHFLEKFSKIYSKNIKRISTPAINMMTIYTWPGNVRELENCMERAVMSSNDSAVSGYNLTAAVRSSYIKKPSPNREDADFTLMVASFERELITEALKSNRGNAAAAARNLNITERVINYKIKRYSINSSWYKNSR